MKIPQVRLITLCLVHFFILPLTAQTPEKPPADMTWEELYDKWQALTTAGKNAAALPYIRLCVEKVRQDSTEASLDYGATLSCLGYSLHHSGHFEEAERIFQSALAHQQKYEGEDTPEYISRLSNLAMLHLDMDEAAKAVSELELAVHKAEKILKEDNANLPIILNNLGLAHEQTGETMKSLHYYQRAMELTERTLGKENPRYAIRLCNVAGVYRKLGKTEQALELDLQALAIFEKKMGKRNFRYAATLNSLATDYSDLNRFPEALATAELLRTTIDSIPLSPSPETYDFASNISRTYFSAGQYDRCIAYSLEAMKAFVPAFPRSFNRASYLSLYLMGCYEKTGRLEEAAQFAVQGYQATLSELRGTLATFSEHEQLQRYSALQRRSDMGFLLFTLRHPEFPELAGKAYEYKMTIKGLALDNRRQLLESLRENPDTHVREQFDTWKQLQNDISRQYALPAGRREMKVDSLESASNELERNLSLASEAFRKGRQAFHWQDVRDALPVGTAAIEFGQLEIPKKDSMVYVAWILRRDVPYPQQVYLFEEKEIGNPTAYRRLYAPESSPNGKNLRELLWKPLEPFLKDISTIYYAPTGVLHQINPDAVPISETEIMEDRFRMHRIISTRELLSGQGKSSYTPPVSALVFGGIRYDADSLALAPTNHLPAEAPAYAESRSRETALGSDLAFLPGSYQEALAVRQALEKTGVRVVFADGFKASEGFLKNSAYPAPSVLHLATHGFFITKIDTTFGIASAENPMARSGLVLSGANRVWSGGKPFQGQEDGILTALEISRMDLSGTQLAVLSACGTGQGQLKAGEGVFGLQRAFKIAGTRYVIMTLWNVQDQHARTFMDLFYEAWLGKKLDIPEAFRQAQRDMRRRFEKPFQPGAWAGFLLLE